MFNIDHFYDIISLKFLRPRHITGFVINEYGKCHTENDVRDADKHAYDQFLYTFQNVYFYDQEPVYDIKTLLTFTSLHPKDIDHPKFMANNILATSEINSAKVEAVCTHNNLTKWYYFYHAFASLDWFRSIQYLPKVENIWQGASFINLNNLYTGPRIYRLLFLSELYKQGLFGEGVISYNCDGYQQELVNNYFINQEQKDQISIWCKQANNKFRLQTRSYENDHGSAESEHPLWTSGFWHVVSETCFYEKTLHLTEKVFKPIVARQPFLLLSTPGALQYLKNYGFKTFDNVIDESYDNITDPYERIKAVTGILKQICNMSESEKKHMYYKIQDAVEFNFEYFYNNFGDYCWDELITNFDAALSESDQKCLEYSTKNNCEWVEPCYFQRSLLDLPSKHGAKMKKLFKQ